MTVVKDIITKKPQYVSPKTSAEEIARAMKEHNCGFMPVAENDKLIGVITDRDIVLRCTAEGKIPAQTLACDIMTPRVLYCFDENTLEDIALNMGENQVRRLPVVDKDKKLVGIVSLGDIAKASSNKEIFGLALDLIAV